MSKNIWVGNWVSFFVSAQLHVYVEKGDFFKFIFSGRSLIATFYKLYPVLCNDLHGRPCGWCSEAGR